MEKRVPFAKAHVLGNSYLVCTEPAGYRLSPRRARSLCAGPRGTEAHGVVIAREGSLHRVRVFNADGSRAEVSGNGLRIYAWWLVSRGDAVPGRRFELRSGNRSYPVVAQRELLSRVGVGLGRPRVREIELPWTPRDAGVRAAWQVRIGNPHCCVLVSEPVSEIDLRQLGALVNRSALFPQGANVEIFAPLSPARVAARVWERGVGETPSSGTGSAAVTAAARRAGVVGNRVDVVMPGGVLGAEVEPGGRLWTWGEVRPELTGELALP